MVVKTIQITTQAVPIVSYHHDRKSLMITVNTGATLYVSQNVVNITTEGTPLFAGQSLEFTKGEGDEPDQTLYGQTLAGTADVRVIEGFEGVDSMTDVAPAKNKKEAKK
jgi:hypothetical protein